MLEPKYPRGNILQPIFREYLTTTHHTHLSDAPPWDGDEQAATARGGPAVRGFRFPHGRGRGLSQQGGGSAHRRKRSDG